MRVFGFKTRSFKSPCMKYRSENESNQSLLALGGWKLLNILLVCSPLPLSGGYYVCNIPVHFVTENRLEDTIRMGPVSQ